MCRTFRSKRSPNLITLISRTITYTFTRNHTCGSRSSLDVRSNSERRGFALKIDRERSLQTARLQSARGRSRRHRRSCPRSRRVRNERTTDGSWSNRATVLRPVQRATAMATRRVPCRGARLSASERVSSAGSSLAKHAKPVLRGTLVREEREREHDREIENSYVNSRISPPRIPPATMTRGVRLNYQS